MFLVNFSLSSPVIGKSKRSALLSNEIYFEKVDRYLVKPRERIKLVSIQFVSKNWRRIFGEKERWCVSFHRETSSFSRLPLLLLPFFLFFFSRDVSMNSPYFEKRRVRVSATVVSTSLMTRQRNSIARGPNGGECRSWRGWNPAREREFRFPRHRVVVDFSSLPRASFFTVRRNCVRFSATSTSPRATRYGDKTGGSWRTGERHPSSFQEATLPPPPPPPAVVLPAIFYISERLRLLCRDTRRIREYTAAKLASLDKAKRTCQCTFLSLFLSRLVKELSPGVFPSRSITSPEMYRSARRNLVIFNNVMQWNATWRMRVSFESP